MELVYTNQKSGFEAGKTYRNPQHFERPEIGVTRVTVVGDWPQVVAAHEEAGVDVKVIEAPKTVIVAGAGVYPQIVNELRRDLEAVGVIVDSFGGELQQPAEGATALRLFEALKQVSESFQDLATERDGLIIKRDELAQENDRLLSEIQGLKDVAAKQITDASEIEGMKAKLEAAGVSYRSNASKESLEKLVADLPKE